jgi:hypothetical protein
VNKLASVIVYWLFMLAASPPCGAADLAALVAALKDGGYVLVFRHGDDSQQQFHSLKFDDMAAPRRVSEQANEWIAHAGSC